MKCVIIANGNFEKQTFYRDILDDADYIICADGGAEHLKRMDILPDIILGDLDSISREDERFFRSRNVRFVTFPAQKDDTDTALATDLAISLNPTEIIYLGTIGSRMDHTLANIGLLKKGLEAGVSVKMINENNEIHLIDSTIELSGTPGDLLSILPMTEKVTGIYLEGLQYPLQDETLRLGSTRGISNVFRNPTACIRIRSGLLLIIRSKD